MVSVLLSPEDSNTSASVTSPASLDLLQKKFFFTFFSSTFIFSSPLTLSSTFIFSSAFAFSSTFALGSVAWLTGDRRVFKSDLRLKMGEWGRGGWLLETCPFPSSETSASLRALNCFFRASNFPMKVLGGCVIVLKDLVLAVLSDSLGMDWASVPWVCLSCSC